MALNGGDPTIGHGFKVEEGKGFLTYYWRCACGETGGKAFRSKAAALAAANAHVARARAER